MLHTLVVGLGRSGRGLHLPALNRARALAGRRRLFSPGPVLTHDIRALRGEPPLPGTRPVTALAEAAALVDPARTVVHLCTPPGVRSRLMADLAALGYRRILVEKPLAPDEPELAAVLGARRRHGLDLVVVAQWLTSALSYRLLAAAREGAFGALRAISVLQTKPRFVRSLTSRAHPTVFDVELPHSVGLALALAGPARVRAAACTDMALGNVEVPRLGQARLVLDHRSGTRTEIFSDLMSPTRERRIRLEFDTATLVGHYPCSEDDDTAQLRTTTEDGSSHLVFHDDALADFMLRAYEHFAGRRPITDLFDIQVRTVRLLAEAKRVCAAPATGAGRAAGPALTEAVPPRA
ncbi:oxidoreductase [Streptomonospora nanhaiensis]|uniref:Putative dehydrogenase n=1 Tax=Streptomonospora nanhaiensis TaxID=1323731 RepID=A0A853BT58_9ACTN|nr:oxidoreductase [Streptomonospora nanhaiensis]MBV2366052.1 oxidoreductase [Streptomonospora nanhaiensis]MBX9389763.1 oxidoreductase [Streptomonospora nanhaiensis]NYI97691.1 putative dehydrogenase [Streptomonospora nanhaiensis]